MFDQVVDLESTAWGTDFGLSRCRNRSIIDNRIVGFLGRYLRMEFRSDCSFGIGAAENFVLRECSIEIFSGKNALHSVLLFETDIIEPVLDLGLRLLVLLITDGFLKIKGAVDNAFVSILHDLNAIFSGIKLIAFEAILIGITIVIGSKIITGEFHLDICLLTRGKKRSLGKSDKLDRRFFDFTFLIGSSKVDLNDILSTVGGSGILHRDRDGKVLVVLSVPGKLFAALETGILQFPLEVGIAKTISERKNDMVLIPGIIVFSSCLVITISKIDALFIINIMFRNGRI